MDLTAKTATQMVRTLAVDSSQVFFTKHAEDRMKARKVTRMQVLRCLTKGLIVEGPAKSVKGNWEFRLECVSAGDALNVAAALDSDDNGTFVVVITAYWV